MLFFSEPGHAKARRIGVILLAVMTLTSCAAQRAYHDGTIKLNQGETAAGLAKLQEAVTLAPDSVEYRMAYLRAKESTIQKLLDDAGAALTADRPNEAENLHKKVLALDSQNVRALAGLKVVEMLRRHSTLLEAAELDFKRKDSDGALEKLHIILTENPAHEGARHLEQSIEAGLDKSPARTTLASVYKKPITIEFKDVPLKTVFEVISRTAGLNFIFDKDIRADQKTSIFLKNSTVEAAVNVMLITNQLEQRILDENTILIYPRTPAKQKDYQQLIIKSFYLTNAEAKNVAATLKALLKSQDVIVDEKLNMLLIKDSPDVIRLAEKLVALHDVPEPEVMMEVEILEVKRSKLLDLGVRWPEKVDFSLLPKTTGGVLTLADLKDIGRDRIGTAIGPASVNIQQQDTDANILANPRIRTRNREKARVLIGERLPNITTTSTSTGFVSESVNYVDVGLKLDVEPIIYPDNEVAIKVSLEVSNIVRQVQTKSGALAFQIGTRNATSVLRLKDGENQVLAGLINNEDRRTANKIPGLGELPLIGRLFGSQTNDGTKTEIVLSITPHVIRNIPRPNASQAEFAVGTDSSMRSGNSPGSSSTTTATATTSTSTTTARSGSSSVMPENAAASSSTATSSSSITPSENKERMPPPPGSPTVPVGLGELRWQGPTQLKSGDAFALQLLMQSNQPVVSLPMAVGFDPQVLQVTSVIEGEFLKQGNATTSFTSRVDPNGQILITGTRSGEGGETTLGGIVTINFRAIAANPEARVQLLAVAPVGLGGSTINAPLPLPQTLVIEP